jgi:protein SCO1/2
MTNRRTNAIILWKGAVLSMRRYAWVALFAIGLLVLPLTVAASEAPTTASHDYLPSASLVDQNGKPVSFAGLKGKPVLISFIHTSCQGVCEMMTAKMKSVATALGPGFNKQVTMVSVTTDPKEDGPAQLKTYAKNQGTVGPGWLFLTGQPDQVDKVLKAYNVPAGDPGDELTHVLEIYLIGPDGRELRHYKGTDIPESAVAADIRSAMARR